MCVNSYKYTTAISLFGFAYVLEHAAWSFDFLGLVTNVQHFFFYRIIHNNKKDAYVLLCSPSEKINMKMTCKYGKCKTVD